MSKNICSCEKCHGHKVMDPATGLSIQGHILGRNKLLKHRHLARIKQSYGVATAEDDVSIQVGSHSQGHSPIPKSEQKSDTAQLSPEGATHLFLPMLWLTTCRLYMVNQDQIQEIQSELSRRRMAYHTLPSRGLVFASTLTGSILMRQVSAEDLVLCPDAIINQSVIEYKGWLQNSISALRGPLRITKGPQSHIQQKLIEEITLATEELHTARREEWSCQLAAMHSQVPIPSFVIDSQCSIVDGGQSHFSTFDKRGAEPPSRKISRCRKSTIGLLRSHQDTYLMVMTTRVSGN